MKNLIITGTSVVLFAASLTGCGWDAVNTTGAMVTDTVNTGVDVLIDRPVSYADMATYRRVGVIHRDGHSYIVKNRRYVIVR